MRFLLKDTKKIIKYERGENMKKVLIAMLAIMLLISLPSFAFAEEARPDPDTCDHVLLYWYENEATHIYICDKECGYGGRSYHPRVTCDIDYCDICESSLPEYHLYSEYEEHADVIDGVDYHGNVCFGRYASTCGAYIMPNLVLLWAKYGFQQL